MFDFFKNIDRRWIFTLMLIAVGVPVYVIGKTKRTFPETALPLATRVFDAMEALDEGDRLLLAFDYDPGPSTSSRDID